MAERELTMAAAISEGIAQEMERDENVFVMGEDVAKYGGIFGSLEPQPVLQQKACVRLWN